MNTLNLSTAVYIESELPGTRLDVQRECLDLHPDLQAFAVEPGTILHDCGPNGVRLFAPDMATFEAAAPVTGSPWDVFVLASDPEPA